MPRDYNEIIQRIESLGLHSPQLQLLGTVHGHPIHRITLKATGPAPKRVLLTAGIHGDEPAGPQAILQFLERNNSRWLPNVEFTIIPCINPHGYIHNTRENKEKIDLNRSFKSDALPEILLTKSVIQNQRFDLFIEFHEDWEYSGFYLFELVRHRPPFGPAIIDAVRKTGPIHPGPEVDEMPVVNGIVQTGEVEVGIEIMPLYIQEFHCHHTLTCESSSQLDLSVRIQSHLTALDTSLDLLCSS